MTSLMLRRVGLARCDWVCSSIIGKPANFMEDTIASVASDNNSGHSRQGSAASGYSTVFISFVNVS